MFEPCRPILTEKWPPDDPRPQYGGSMFSARAAVVGFADAKLKVKWYVEKEADVVFPYPLQIRELRKSVIYWEPMSTK